MIDSNNDEEKERENIRREIKRLTEEEQKSINQLKQVSKEYLQANKEMEEFMDYIYEKYGLDPTKEYEITDEGEIKEVKRKNNEKLSC